MLSDKVTYWAVLSWTAKNTWTVNTLIQLEQSAVFRVRKSASWTCQWIVRIHRTPIKANLSSSNSVIHLVHISHTRAHTISWHLTGWRPAAIQLTVPAHRTPYRVEHMAPKQTPRAGRWAYYYRIFHSKEQLAGTQLSSKPADGNTAFSNSRASCTPHKSMLKIHKSILGPHRGILRAY